MEDNNKVHIEFIVLISGNMSLPCMHLLPFLLQKQDFLPAQTLSKEAQYTVHSVPGFEIIAVYSHTKDPYTRFMGPTLREYMSSS